MGLNDGGVVIEPYGEHRYYFDLPSAANEFIQISITTRDWQTNQNLYVSNVAQPKCSQAPTSGQNIPPNSPTWYNINDTSNESVFLMQKYQAHQRFYVTVCNKYGMEGKYAIYWAHR